MNLIEYLRELLGYHQPTPQQTARPVLKGPIPAAPTGNYPSYPENLSSLWDGSSSGEAQHRQTVQSMFSSPFIDSLVALAGARPKMSVSRLPSTRDRGEYDPWRGELKISDFPLSFTKSGESRNNTPASQPSVRSAIIHEMGHVASQKGKYYTPKTGPSFKIAQKDTSSDMTPAEKASVLNLDPYYRNNNEEERYAQAFTNAFQFLQDSAKDPKMDWSGYLGKLEGNTPGTGAFVVRMLKEPIYKNHPLKQILAPEEKHWLDALLEQLTSFKK